MQLAFILTASVALARVVSVAELPGCLPPKTSLKPGFTVDIYEYPQVKKPDGSGCYSYVTSAYNNEEWYRSGYANMGRGLIDTVTGVSDVTFFAPELSTDCDKITPSKLPPAYNYDKDISITNITLLITGYFYAEKTGSYTFTMLEVDNIGYFNIGDKDAFSCCQKSITINSPGPYVPYEYTRSTTVNLVAGTYYPLRILYSNFGRKGTLNVPYTDPDGVTHKTFDGVAFSAADGDYCPVPSTTTTVPWTGTYTTSETGLFTTTGSDGKSTTGIIITVETPGISTTTIPWTGTYTATSTDVTSTTGVDGKASSSTIVVVQTPQKGSETNVLTPWTGTYETTYSTEAVTMTDFHGSTYVQTVYYVDIPDHYSRSIEKEPWTESFTSTYSIDTIMTTDSEGHQCVNIIYHVKTPYISYQNSTVSSRQSTVTSVIDGVTTVFTTYCPVSTKAYEHGISSKLNAPKAAGEPDRSQKSDAVVETNIQFPEHTLTYVSEGQKPSAIAETPVSDTSYSQSQIFSVTTAVSSFQGKASRFGVSGILCFLAVLIF